LPVLVPAEFAKFAAVHPKISLVNFMENLCTDEKKMCKRGGVSFVGV
jgi:hypothetical protein